MYTVHSECVTGNIYDKTGDGRFCICVPCTGEDCEGPYVSSEYNIRAGTRVD